MEKLIVTVQSLSVVAGPGGVKLRPGQIASLEDSPYVRLLIKSGNVQLVDPPSLDQEYLESAGLVPKTEKPVVEAKVEEPVAEEPVAEAKEESPALKAVKADFDKYLTKKAPKVSEPTQEEAPEAEGEE